MIDQLNQTTQELEKKIPAAAETVDTAARWPWGSHAAVKKDTSVRERMIATASKVVNVRIPTEVGVDPRRCPCLVWAQASACSPAVHSGV